MDYMCQNRKIHQTKALNIFFLYLGCEHIKEIKIYIYRFNIYIYKHFHLSFFPKTY